MLPAALKADCYSCHALCCAVHAFDASQGFGFDKPAHTICPLLKLDNRCSIHDRLLESGFCGCAAYDCYGAGQWVTQRFCAEGSWRDSAERAARVFELFSTVRAAREVMAIIATARAYVQDAGTQRVLSDVYVTMDSICRDGPPVATRSLIAAEKRRVLQLLRADRVLDARSARQPRSPRASRQDAVEGDRALR